MLMPQPLRSAQPNFNAGFSSVSAPTASLLKLRAGREVCRAYPYSLIWSYMVSSGSGSLRKTSSKRAGSRVEQRFARGRRFEGEVSARGKFDLSKFGLKRACPSHHPLLRLSYSFPCIYQQQLPTSSRKTPSWQLGGAVLDTALLDRTSTLPLSGEKFLPAAKASN